MFFTGNDCYGVIIVLNLLITSSPDFTGFDLSSASNYFFIDLFAIICMLGSIWLLGNQRRAGFAVGLMGAISFVIFGLLAESLFAILGNLLLGAIYLRGWFRWTPQGATQKMSIPESDVEDAGATQK